MTDQEIKDHFKQPVVYKFNGTISELHDMCVALSASYNYLIDNHQIYFVSPVAVSDNRVVEI